MEHALSVPSEKRRSNACVVKRGQRFSGHRLSFRRTDIQYHALLCTKKKKTLVLLFEKDENLFHEVER